MLSATDGTFFDLCFKLAETAYDAKEVPVGCAIVVNNEVVGTGFNQVNRTKNPTRHAEFVAIDEADEWCKLHNKNFTEPCVMCASALYQLGIQRLVFGAKNPRFGGIYSVASNTDYGHEHQIDIISEVDKDRCIALLRTFYDRENPFAPEEKRKTKNGGKNS
ncbi:hypothetical protein niasHS_014460 [Heterodera schachtii]|uniref:CMP/dCMP-type deaminase domain-containing protein n=2 Tax=Heterodera TaxID=34509 RepID=A0ABD2IG99_HETSC